MFESIRELAVCRGIDAHTQKKSLTPQEKLEIAQNVIRKLGEEALIRNAEQIQTKVFGAQDNQINHITFNCAAFSAPPHMQISPFFLIEAHELDELGTESTPLAIANCIRKNLGFEPLQTISPMETQQIRRFLEWKKLSLQDRTAQMQYVLTHELGHIYHNHQGAKFILSTTILCLSPFLLMTSLIVVPIFIISLLIAQPILGVSIALIILLAIIITNIYLVKKFDQKINHHRELQADTFATKLVGAQAGIDTFNGIFKNKNSADYSHSHPSSEKRIQNMKQVDQTRAQYHSRKINS